MTSPGHEMILASAGSGKTYALTHRFVRLLALGAPPDRIVALTFTRKAAGEFFDEILRKLARAAVDAPFAATIAREMEVPAARPEDFRRFLRTAIDAMPRLALGTFDSFFARVVRAFPLELGLSGDFELLEEHAEHIERRRVLERLFAGVAGGGSAAAQRAFIEAFKRATFGLEEKQLGGRLDAFIDSHQEIFLNAPDGDLWGNAARIWPEDCDWFRQRDADDVERGLHTLQQQRETAATALQTTIATRTDLNDGQRARWAAFFAELPDWTPAAPLPKPVEYVLRNTLDAWDKVAAGGAEIVVEKKRMSLEGGTCRTLATIVRSIVGAELLRRLEITRGIHAVLAHYDDVYDEHVRRAGRLTFADVQRLLESGQSVLGARELIDWRLDGRFDHWLLDEFQDTSPGQWSVLRNLIDEVVQDPSGRRTFFYVGDVKQAIYAWREGDARLFREIFNHYNATALRTSGALAIAERRLDQSWRSGPATLEMVNRVFGAKGVLAHLFPADAAARWSEEWRPHSSAKTALEGHAAWLLADDEDARFALALRVLEEIRPLTRGLTTAVLVQKNDTAARLADYLRREGRLPAVAESDLHVCTDNPLSAALLALFKAAAHPGDTLAREHVRMSPLHAALVAAEITTPDSLSSSVLAGITTGGYEHSVETWLRRIEPLLASDDAFSRERGGQMVEAARLFDEAGGGEMADFIAFLERHTVREAESAAVVRVMTIHKAKGLGFDVVVLPDLEGQSLAQRRDGLAVQKTETREIAWVLDLPTKLFREQDKVLAAHVRAAEADACYDKLALLYVAMTRAKRGMYLVTEPPKPKSQSNNFVKLLASTLGTVPADVRIGTWSGPALATCGKADWFERAQPAPPAPRDAGIVAPAVARERAPRFPARRPSEAKGGVLAGAALFGGGGGDPMAFGTAVHTALAAVEWHEGDAGAATLPASLPAAAATEARACLAAPALAEVFIRPTALAEVWRERAFEAVIDGSWVSGVFDRVIVERGPDGSAARVRVYDFKTDRVGTDSDAWQEAAERYRGQLTLYRAAAALLTGAPPERVSCAIVFTGALDTAGRRPEPIVVLPAS
jgi:ATP-dependent helicase/nuclease subunit A